MSKTSTLTVRLSSDQSKELENIKNQLGIATSSGAINKMISRFIPILLELEVSKSLNLEYSERLSVQKESLDQLKSSWSTVVSLLDSKEMIK